MIALAEIARLPQENQIFVSAQPFPISRSIANKALQGKIGLLAKGTSYDGGFEASDSIMAMNSRYLQNLHSMALRV
ncbi:MAG: hypothetical protein ACLFVT_00005 [Syntrophobacteria bacterium]